MFALLGGKPKDLIGWKIVTDGAANLMSELSPEGRFTQEDTHHRRAHPETPYPSVSRGVSLGGGQTVIVIPYNFFLTHESPATRRAMQSPR